ncbi:putative xylanase 3 protein [Phaeoacremonium minimum UCRPA7]|uniref:Putative xylanase 3 protein n=1 Tax=Phaeoacremonium minimum (strain UCR-PA7) TaxID=1286976 RepID=R8BEL2_PHAM7|nr:putative xylanase 3 protein [Phaeoacremonium minimum UCRPA7]EON97744.1 putative xylanase 3 protein [Phaeoacremonium minimum UCRPA7]
MSLRASLKTFALLGSTLIPVVTAKAQLVKDSGCDCYMTNGSNVAFYTDHRFYDFRNLSQYQGVPELLTDPDDAADADPTSGYFTTEEWNSTWGIQSWNNSGSLTDGTAAVLMVNSPNNIYISQNTDDSPTSHTYLVMRTARHPDFQSAAEMESIGKGYQFLSVRMLARTIGSPGACTALFTYRGGDKPSQVQEADIEVLTEGPRNMIQYTNQPSFTDGNDSDDIPQATRNATMPNGLDWSDWAVHRLDWTPKQSTWYVDGVEVASISFQTPRDPSQVILNAWSNGGGWSGNMTVHDEAFMQIQWLEMVFNSTQEVADWTDTANITDSSGVISRRSDKACKTVCSIDDTIIRGVANKLWTGAAPGRLYDQSEVLVRWRSGLALLAMLFMV